MLKLRPNNIPTEMQNLPQWVNCRLPSKVPVRPCGGPAKSNNTTTWHSFDECAEQTRDDQGISFAFACGGGMIGADLDGCRDPRTGEIASWATEILNRLNSYCEVSPSGTGVKVFVRGQNDRLDQRGLKRNLDHPQCSDKGPALELYSQGRFFVVTGHRLEQYPSNCQERSAEVGELIAEYWLKPQPRPQATHRADPGNLLERARKYLATLPAAIAGQSGHNSAFYAACCLVQGFELPADRAFELLWNEYNPRCEPPWSEAELRHKVASAGQLRRV